MMSSQIGEVKIQISLSIHAFFKLILQVNDSISSLLHSILNQFDLI
jgi:hypothetical protein